MAQGLIQENDALRKGRQEKLVLITGCAGRQRPPEAGTGYRQTASQKLWTPERRKKGDGRSWRTSEWWGGGGSKKKLTLNFCPGIRLFPPGSKGFIKILSFFFKGQI